MSLQKWREPQFIDLWIDWIKNQYGQFTIFSFSVVQR
ncbi:Protein of unknown function [Bacillus mycoides]|nr:Protein of unknown function [Bacillus mycoides]